MRSYRPEELFDANGTLVPELKALAPQGNAAHEREPARQRRPAPQGAPAARISAATPCRSPSRGTTQHENTKPLGEFLRDVMRNNPTNFRVFGPDETASNRLQAIYEASKKTWMADVLPEDADGGELAPRRPRHGDALRAHAARLARGLPAHGPARLLPHVRGVRARHRLDVQPARQVARHLQEPRPVARARRLGEHPAVLDGVAAGPQRLLAPGSGVHRPGDEQERRRSRASTCRPTPTRCSRSPTTACAAPTASTSSSPTSRSTCSSRRSTRPSSTARRASASGRGRAPTPARSPTSSWRAAATSRRMEALAAASILRERVPDLKLRFVNVVDLFKMQPASEHPHGSTERDFDGLFTTDKPIIFNFHGYPWLIHKLAYRFKSARQPARARLQGEGQHQHAVRARDAERDVALPPGHRRHRSRAESSRADAAHLKEEMRNAIIDNLRYAHEHGARSARDLRLDLAGLTPCDDGLTRSSCSTRARRA